MTTTFDQALANLQNSNNQRALEAQGYNNDVAEFQTKKAKDTARLFMLAGEIGKDLSTRLAERREKEKKAEKLTKQLEHSYYGNYEVDYQFRESVFKTELGQNQMSSILAKSINEKKLSAYAGTEEKSGIGTGERALMATQLNSIALEFSPWYYHQIRNNEGSFTVNYVDEFFRPRTKTINLNASNLSRDEQFARLQYLTKQYVGKTASQYSDKFLTYDQKDGGSGYAKTLMSQNDTIKKEIEKNLTIESGVKDRTSSKLIITDTEEMNESTLQTAVNLVLNSSNLEGTGILRRDKAWKEIHGIYKDAAESGKLRRDKIIEHVDLDLGFEVNGNRTLATIFPSIYGHEGDVTGSVIKEAETFSKNLNKEVEINQKAITLERMSAFKKRINEGVATWDSKEALELLHERDREDPSFDFAEGQIEFKGEPTPASKATAKEVMTRYRDKPIGERRSLDFYLVGHPLEHALRNDPEISAQLSIEKNIGDLLKKNLLKAEQKVSNTDRKNLGLKDKAVWADVISGSDYWRVVEAEAIHRYLDSQNRNLGKSPQDIIHEILEETRKVPKLKTSYKQHLIKRGLRKTDDGKFAIDEKYAKDDWTLHETSYHAQDNDGVYYNIHNHETYKNEKLINVPKLLSPTWYEDSLKNKEINDLSEVNLTDKNNEFPGKANLIEKYPKGEGIDWEKYVLNEKTITPEIDQLCKAKGITTAECIQQLAEGSGQTLSEKALERLGGDWQKNVSPKLLSQYRKGEQPITTGGYMEIANATNYAGVTYVTNGGEQAEETLNAFSGEYIDSKGQWKSGQEEIGKLQFGINLASLLGIHPRADRDFQEGGAVLYAEATKGISTEDKLSMLRNNDNAAFKAAAATGDIRLLNKENFAILKDKEDQDNRAILDVIGASLDNKQSNPYIT